MGHMDVFQRSSACYNWDRHIPGKTLGGNSNINKLAAKSIATLCLSIQTTPDYQHQILPRPTGNVEGKRQHIHVHINMHGSPYMGHLTPYVHEPKNKHNMWLISVTPRYMTKELLSFALAVHVC